MGEHAGFGLRTRERGRHRTEVTEVTEGGGCSTNTIGWTLVVSVREHAYGERHRTEVTEVTEGGGCSTNALGWTLVASVREHAYGEGIAQRSRRSQRGRLVDECAWVDTGGFRAGTRVWERHRTEVTEVTEGGGCSTNTIGWTLVVSVREHAYGKGIAQRSRRS